MPREQPPVVLGSIGSRKIYRINQSAPQAKILSNAPAAVADWEAREVARQAKVADLKAGNQSGAFSGRRQVLVDCMNYALYLREPGSLGGLSEYSILMGLRAHRDEYHKQPQLCQGLTMPIEKVQPGPYDSADLQRRIRDQKVRDTSASREMQVKEDRLAQ
ncbi:hypothetical protein FPCIR_11584 [Fusarium pseudocircinatum]|uniref:Uncharacterized protein n=1 Tax=Fusarium pseudocircinatum TaxID=56676 RepID=A0A8H5NU67_9HYPO|nr:hypothetical protein FPCIR_11584 [Fusarium pseudocircinatum]